MHDSWSNFCQWYNSQFLDTCIYLILCVCRLMPLPWPMFGIQRTNCICLFFPSTIRVLGIELRTSGLVAGAFTHWAMSLVAQYYSWSIIVPFRLMSLSTWCIAGGALLLSCGSLCTWGLLGRHKVEVLWRQSFWSIACPSAGPSCFGSLFIKKMSCSYPSLWTPPFLPHYDGLCPLNQWARDILPSLNSFSCFVFAVRKGIDTQQKFELSKKPVKRPEVMLNEERTSDII